MESLLARQRSYRNLEKSNNRKRSRRGWSALALTSAIIAGTIAIATTVRAQNVANDAELLKDAQDTFEPLPKNAATAEAPVAPERVDLGRKLFFDPRFSVDGTVSCARCHQPALYGTDGLAKSHGAHDALNARRAPTVLNVALQFKLHWRGDRENVEEQAERALTGAQSFGNPDSASATARLKAIGDYLPLFQKAFPDDTNPVNASRNWGRGHRCLRADFADAIAIRRIPCRQRRGPLDSRKAGIAKIHQHRLFRLPQRCPAGWRQFPEIWRRG